LIKQGAKLVQDWNDVIVELPAEVRRQLIERGRNRLLGSAAASPDGGPASQLGAETEGSLAEIGRRLLAVLQVDKAIHLDDLLQNLEDSSASELIAALFELEMLGLIKQLPGKNFVKVW
jgi:DNA processing protein